MSIISVLLNPTIDQIYEINDFKVGGTYKVDDSAIFPVGKAISFSLALKEINFNEDMIHVKAFVGKKDIDQYSSFLDSKNITHELIPVDGKTRSNKTINDPINKTTTHIRESGFELNANYLAKLKDSLSSSVSQSDYVIFSGSIPPNTPDEIYFELIESCKRRKAKSVLDTSGNALIQGIKARPTIIKPNLAELSQILENVPLKKLKEWEGSEKYMEIARHGRGLIDEGIKTILITLGEKGALLVDDDLLLHGAVKVEEPVDTVGSGDAFLAGFVYQEFHGASKKDAFKSAVASGAANTLVPGPGIFNKNDYNKLLNEVEISEL